jgi:transcriptional regulator with XRE-family HTH domain
MKLEDVVKKYGSQKRAAEVLNTSQEHLSRILTGKVKLTFAMMKKIADNENLKLWEIVKSYEEDGYFD